MDVLEYFKKITEIPRPSKKEREIRKFIIDIAKKNGLSYVVDRVGNLLVKKDGSTKFSDGDGIIFQGHLDMVCEQEKNLNFNFNRHPINIYEDNGFLKARGTTLGADNGVAIAYMLALMEDKILEHPNLDFLFTVDEETGLTGASKIDKKMLRFDNLINLDSEEENVIYIGCAGGAILKGEKKYKRSSAEYGKFFKIEFSGLLGGHSGSNINENRANVIKVIFDYLNELEIFDRNFDICSIIAGDKHNVIPRDGEVVISTDMDIEKLDKAGIAYKMAFENEPLEIKVFEVDRDFDIIGKEEFYDLKKLISEIPHGVKAISKDFKNVVETSLNLASINLQNGKIFLVLSVRSLIENEKELFCEELKNILKNSGFNCKLVDRYSSWQGDKNSDLLDSAIKCHKKKPKITAIHAGLECGVLGAKKEMNMISIGPNIYDVHSPKERLDIKSFYHVYEIIKCLIQKK